MKKEQKYFDILINVLKTAKLQNYSGYSKYDALNSPFLYFLSSKNSWLRLFFTQIVMRSPVNLRPLLGVKKGINPKGMALFGKAYLLLYEKTHNKKFLNEATLLINWLLENPSPNQPYLCWGYNYIWQDIPPFCQKRYQPNIVVSIFAGETLIHIYRITKNQKYLKALISIANFITKDLPVLYESENEKAISYVKTEVDSIVLNIQALSAALLVKIYKHTQNKNLLETARKQMNFTINHRTPYFAWYYTHPSYKSYIRHDNYHTGGIIDAILEYCEETKDNHYIKIYLKALEFYQNNLFESNGAPRWMSDKKYPYDIHGCAQGIISFKKASCYNKKYLKQAEKIADWTIANLYRLNKHDFIYRKGRIIKYNYSLMRWCNAWMTRALAEIIS